MQDYYSTCFEVEVVSDAAARQAKLAARGQNDFSLPCDTSVTSTGEVGSTIGCDTSGSNTGSGSTGSGSDNDSDNDNDVVPTEDPDFDPATMGSVYTNQMTGKIYLPTASVQPSKRKIHVVVSWAHRNSELQIRASDLSSYS